jgi:hypothetical protein
MIFEVVGEGDVGGEYWGSLGREPNGFAVTAVIDVGGVIRGEGGWWVRVWWGCDRRCGIVTYDAVASFQERVYNLLNVD